MQGKARNRKRKKGGGGTTACAKLKEKRVSKEAGRS
jgi:hypothetical protein